MLTYPAFNPVAFSIGSFDIYWYGLTYLFGFLLTYWYCLRFGQKETPPWNQQDISNLLFYIALGVVLGGRLGYLLFYTPVQLLEAPLSLFNIRDPGRSFHGGVIGALLTLLVFCRNYQRSLLSVTDFLLPITPLAIALGRFGNFINGELWGRKTDLPWGMVFSHVDAFPRHPSQLYEMCLEGFLLFFILLSLRSLKRDPGKITGRFLFFYGIFRFLVEFVREPDAHQGYIAFDWMSMGQILSIPMILVGALFLFHRKTIVKYS